MNKALFSDLEFLNPVSEDGFSTVFEREFPVEVRSKNDIKSEEESGRLVVLSIKLCTKDENLFKIHMTSESDLFFNFSMEVDDAYFANLKHNQQLLIQLDDFPGVIVGMLNNCVDYPDEYFAIFTIQDEHAELRLVRNLEYKFVDLLSLNFIKISDDKVREVITVRYLTMKSKLALAEQRITELCSAMKIKQPSAKLN